MFLGLGVMAGSSAVFHVFTHAFFKALLFLSAGSVMHAMGGELDIRKMSGIRRVMPITHITMLIGCIALAGVPGFAGFFSKDEIIGHAINSHMPYGFILGCLGLLVALMTAYYTFRVYFKVFLGPLELPPTAGHHEPSPFALDDGHGAHGVDTVHAKQGHEEASHGQDAAGHAHPASGGHDSHAHGPNDGSPLLWLPLLVLCIGAIGAGYLGFERTGDWLHKFVEQVPGLGNVSAEGPIAEAAAQHEAVPESVLLALAFALPLLGILIAWYFYLKNRAAAAAMAARFRPLVNFLNNKWYIDEIYSALLLKPLWFFAHFLSYFDRYVVDGLVFIVGFIPQLAGYILKPTQRGLLQRYAVGMVAGLAAVVGAVLYLIWKA
jgi:NADH-quinone oxidoreductase subunit L